MTLWTDQALARVGLGFFALMGCLFIGLRVAGVVAWSWWWVTAPLWAPLASVAVLAAGVFVAAIVLTAFEGEL